MTKFQFVTAVHGNESVPVAALADKGVSQVVANPKAFVKRKRFIDQDLNAAFGKPETDYETRRAKELSVRLSKKMPVVDIHTFTNRSPAFVIVVDLKMLWLAKRTGIPRVVYMKHNIKSGHALIDHFPGISVEVGSHKSERSYRQTQELIGRVQSGKEGKVEVFEVYDTIKHKDKYANFEKHSLGFYPVLAGKSSYKHFGLKARLMSQ